MKKIFTLLVGGAFALASQAAPAVNVPTGHSVGDFSGMQMTLKPENLQKMRDALPEGYLTEEQFNAGTPGKFQKIHVDQKNGCLWTFELENTGMPYSYIFGWLDEDGNEIDLEDYPNANIPQLKDIPFYAVILSITQRTDSETYFYTYALEWPTISTWRQIPYWLNADVAEEDCDPEDYTIVSVDDLINTVVHPDDRFTPIAHPFKEKDIFGDMATEGAFGALWPDNWVALRDGKYYYNKYNPDYWTCMYVNGSLPGAFDRNDNNVLVGNGIPSEFEFTSYDAASSWLECNAIVSAGSASNRKAFSYSSFSLVSGFGTSWINMDEPSEVHIFNSGSRSHADDGDLDVYAGDWGPFDTYRVMIPGKYFTVEPNPTNTDNKYGNGKWLFFDNEELAKQDGVDMLEEYTYIVGTIFCEPGSDIEKGGEWKMKAAQPLGSSYITTPEAGCMIEAYAPWAEKSEYWMLYYKYNSLPVTGDAMFTLGTTEGLQFLCSNSDTYFYQGYKGDITYHYDVDDTTKTKTFSSIGAIENSVNEIEAAEDVAPVYYNLQGVRVDNPEKGLFIKVQGNKSTKVVL